LIALPILEQLQLELQRGRVVVVVGAGVSRAAADLPGWKSAVESAIDHLRQMGTVTPQELDSLGGQLSEASTPAELAASAMVARSLLTGSSEYSGEFASWLEKTIGINASNITNQT
jgi:hypothetical protein